MHTVPIFRESIMKATIEDLLPYLCCPKTGSTLSLHDGYLRSDEGETYPFLDGIADFVGKKQTDADPAICDHYKSIAGRKYDTMVKNGKLMKLVWDIDLTCVPSVKDLANNFSSGIVLDVPCGTSVYEVDAYLAKPETTFIAIDYSMAMLTAAAARCQEMGIENVVYVRADVSRLPIRKAVLDGCLSLNSFHVFPRPEQAASEIARCLKPGAPIQTTIICSNRLKRSDIFMNQVMIPKGFFKHSLPVSHYIAMLEEAGFEDSVVQNFGALAFIKSSKLSAAQ